MEKIISVQHISKAYQKHLVVKDLSFDVQQGEILCLLGPNGAGKTTTIHMIASLLKSDQGDIFYQGESIVKCRRTFQKQLGFIPLNLALYEDLSAYENLRFFAGLYGLKTEQREKRIEEALAFAGLGDRQHDRVSTYSTGMKRRLNIACGIVHRPRFVIMDEPTVGIDPQSRNHILSSILRLKEQGMTILYTTHYMEEVETLSSRILIMDHGTLIAQGTKEALQESMEKQIQYCMQMKDATLVDMNEFYAIEGVQKVTRKANTITITSLKQVENLDSIIQEAVKQKLKIEALTTQRTSLETLFLNLTGRSLRDRGE